MLNETVAALINEQVNKELYSAYLYLHFANYYADAGLNGFANWYEVQAKEERDHAFMMRRYLLDSGIAVQLSAIACPEGAFENYLQPLEAGLAHERYVTSLIFAICKQANACNDYKTLQFLDWFVKEQGEEEKNAEDLVKKMKLFGTDAKGLYALNQELLARAYAAPTNAPAM